MANLIAERKRRNIHRVAAACAAVALALFSAAAQAQWSIGQPGTREAPKGQNRYVYLVMSDPLPGRAFDFNDDYQNMHMCVLVQLPGWMAAQRFHLATPPPGAAPPRLKFTKYLVIWETEGTNAQGLQDALIAATKAGQVKTLAADPATAQSSWWVTTSPFINKDDFQR